MPLEALIDPDTGGVIVVKPVGSVWGRCEVNAVMLLDDPALEKELAEREHLVYPYAAYEETASKSEDREFRRREMLAASLVKVAVFSAAALEIPSRKRGVLRVPDADRPTIVAKIAEVLAPPVPQKGGK